MLLKQPQVSAASNSKDSLLDQAVGALSFGKGSSLMVITEGSILTGCAILLHA